MAFRKIFFWTHLAAGVVAGSVILIMSVTGTLLTFQQSVLKMIERDHRVVTPPADGSQRLPVDVLLQSVRTALPDAQPATLTLDSDPTAAAAVALGTAGTAYVDPYTGQVLGFGSPRARAFYRSVTNWHRWLAVEGEGRATARAITGACNTAFLVLAVSGLYLWWPRQWTAKHLLAVVWFKRGLRGKARDFNWHNAIGFWCAPVIIVLTATGMVISYTWASNLVYTITGSPRPAPAAGRGGGPAAENGPAGQGRGRGNATAAAERPAARPADTSGAQTVAAGASHAGPPPTLDSLVARAAGQVPTWRTMVIRLPRGQSGPVAFTISDREHWNSFARSTLTLDGGTGADIRWEPYAGTSLGQKVRGWMRFAHTGELGGIPGEAVAGLASAGGGFLVWTGIALSLRRLAAWRGRRRRVATQQPVLLPMEEDERTSRVA